MTGWSPSDVGLRPLVADDLPLVYDWLGREHVARWWGQRAGFDEATAEYLDAIEGRDPTELYTIRLGDEDVGLIQTYLLADYPEYEALVDAGPAAAGLDIFLGDESLVGRGLGTHVIGIFAETVVFARPETLACVADPDVRNLPSIRAFEKAGFSRVHDFYDPDDDAMHALVRRYRA